MQKNDNILNFLKELVRFRQKEILQMQKARCAQSVLLGYSNRTSLIIDTIQKIESKCADLPIGTENDIEQFDILAKELADLKQKYTAVIQLCADYKSQKARLETQLSEKVQTLTSNLLLQILKVVDDFDRVQDSIKTYESNPVIEGIKLVYANLLKILDAEGCKKIVCKSGDVFDVNFHEAVASLPHEPGQENSGTIAQVVQAGWLLNGSLLRAAKVIVRL